MSGRARSFDLSTIRGYIAAFFHQIDALVTELADFADDELEASASDDVLGASSIAVSVGRHDASPLLQPATASDSSEQLLLSFTQLSGPTDWHDDSDSEGIPSPLHGSVLLRLLLSLPTLLRRSTTTASPGGRTHIRYLVPDARDKAVTIIKESDHVKIEQHRDGSEFKFSRGEPGETIMIQATVANQHYEFSYRPDRTTSPTVDRSRRLEDVATGGTPQPPSSHHRHHHHTLSD